MRARYLILLLLFVGILQAATYSYADIHRMPRGVEKDYFIWRYISQRSTSKKDAKRVIREASHINKLLRTAYRKKTGKNPPRVASRRHGRKVTAAEKARYKKMIALRKAVFNDKDPLGKWMALSPEEKLFVFNSSGKKGRRKLDHRLDRSEWDMLCKAAGFGRSIRYIMRENLPMMKKALLYPPQKQNAIDSKTLTRLGFYALYLGKKSISYQYFLAAASKAPKREDADKALFWAWQVSKKKKVLKRLAKSYDINIYTLAARDILDMPYPKIPKLSLPSGGVGGFDIKDPIEWSRLKRKIFTPGVDLGKLAERFKKAETVGIYTYIKNKESRDTVQYFPMPYRNIVKKLPKSRQAILYAIARQESRFIPASVSRSYALGMMQIMPFLVKHIAKIRHEKIDYNDMFDPKKAIVYANEHMNYLTKWLRHPLFIAYAYNAGIGFTKRLIRRKNFFHTNSDYEPWLSLERIENGQANHYGKKVLANYVIYMNMLGVEVRLSDLMEILHKPEMTDKFRSAVK